MTATKNLALAVTSIAVAVLAAGCGSGSSGHAASPPTTLSAPATTIAAPAKLPPAPPTSTNKPAPPVTAPPALVVSTPAVQVVADCFKKSYEPATIILVCGDGNALFTEISWSSWGQYTAVGTAQLLQNDCQPYCAEGTFHHYPGRITLSGVRQSPIGALFSIAVFTFDGTPPRYTSPTETWQLTVPDTVRNLFISDQTKAQLVNAFMTAQHLTANEIQGIEPGSVYYAHDVTTDTYWAVATILPSSWYLALPSSVQTNFVGGPWAFIQASGSSWQEAGALGNTCFLPHDVLAAWGKTTANCQFPPS